MIKNTIPSGSGKQIHNRLSNSGSILVSVLAILFILLTIFIAVLTFVLARYSYHVQNHNELIAQHLSNAGIQRYINHINADGIKYDTLSYETPNNGNIISYAITWGPYLLVVSEGSYANQTVKSTALLGSIPSDIFNDAVTVYDVRFPLVAAGNTAIIGDVNTGPLGVTTGLIRGEGPANDNFLKGDNNIYPSFSTPKIDTMILNKYISDFLTRQANNDLILQGSYIFNQENQSLFNDKYSFMVENNAVFQNISISAQSRITTLTVKGSTEFRGNNNIKGIMEINSDGPIYVNDSTMLDQVLLYSTDSIVLGGNIIFSGIAISETKIVVKNKANLEYPSFLMVRNFNNNRDIEGGIYINSRGNLESVCYLSPLSGQSDDRSYLLYLDSNSIFTGYLIAHEQAWLHGTVNGSIVANHFIYQLGSSTYINWLDDININRSKLSYDLLLPMLQPDSNLSINLIRQDSYL